MICTAMYICFKHLQHIDVNVKTLRFNYLSAFLVQPLWQYTQEFQTLEFPTRLWVLKLICVLCLEPNILYYYLRFFSEPIYRKDRSAVDRFVFVTQLQIIPVEIPLELCSGCSVGILSSFHVLCLYIVGCGGIPHRGNTGNSSKHYIRLIS